MIFLYLGLLGAGVGLFVLSYVAQFRLAALLRKRYPQHWQIIAEAEQGRPSVVRSFMRMQHVLRSPALPALGDETIDRWRNVWRYSPWLGWLSWLAALGMRLLLG
ncbi:MAG TPA: hypothetical protein VN043_16380 [Rhodanobacter sp.]|nr:hypothetical protein [Rhodanobacter sp.]